LETDADRTLQVQLARHIAADQLHYARSELMDLWRESPGAWVLRQHNPVVYPRQVPRASWPGPIALATARLGVVPGAIDGLVADAWEAAGTDSDSTRAPSGSIADDFTSPKEDCAL
jgi:hypothetical protein